MSPFILRGPLVHPRPDLSYLGVDLFERIAQRGQRLEQVVPVKAPEVGWASVPGVLKEGQPGPHARGPQAPFLGVIGFSKCRIDVFREDMEPPVEISLRACGKPALLRVVRASVDPAVDLLDLLSKVSKLRKHFGLKEG